MSCPSLRTAAPPPCLPLGIKDSLKKDARLLDGGGFLMRGFWLKGNCWRVIAEGKIAEGRIAKGKRIAEGEFIKGNC
jgi:hypothetical protein